MSADSVTSSKTNIFQSKIYTLIYCRHLRTYSRCAMFDWNDTVFRRRNVTRRRISNTVLQPRDWGSEADSPEVCRLIWLLKRYSFLVPDSCWATVRNSNSIVLTSQRTQSKTIKTTIVSVLFRQFDSFFGAFDIPW
jgi:hypothetical protein